MFGGRDAVGPRVEFQGSRSDGPLKANALPARRGDVMVLETGGGGGYGDPLARDAERVRRDVRNGFVTRAGAERDYGVILTDALDVDGAATAKRRDERRRAGGAGK